MTEEDVRYIIDDKHTVYVYDGDENGTYDLPLSDESVGRLIYMINNSAYTLSPTCKGSDTIGSGTSMVIPAGMSEILTAISGGWINYRGIKKIGTFTRDISLTSDLSITGIGFQPSIVFIFGGISGSNAISIGMSDGTNNYRMSYSPGASNWGVGTGYCIIINVSSGNNNNAAASMTSDGFDLAWTKTGSPTGTATFFYLAK